MNIKEKQLQQKEEKLLKSIDKMNINDFGAYYTKQTAEDKVRAKKLKQL